ncbi:MAG: aspartyl protease family protein [Chloroflexota bacterium]|nr:aspartyl protease family protein [Chloroflexota bacterium]MDE2961434.1 aspartyl protease family protein [Chloroflexota bacterium]
MHYGTVNRYLEPIVSLTALYVNSEEERIDFTIDTGFTEEIALPPDIIEQLGLPQEQDDAVLTLADGTNRALTVHTGWVEWHGQIREVDAISADTTPLLGMKMLAGGILNVEATPGGAVTITRIELTTI